MVQASAPIEVTVPGRFYPPHSLLGLAMARRVGDGYRAETIYLLVSVLLVTGAVVAGFAASALGFGALEWPGALLGFGLLLCIFAGYRRRVVIRLTADRLSVRQGATRLDVAVSTIGGCEVLDSVAYHRNEARLPGVLRFVNDYRHALVRLQAGDTTVVLGIPCEQAPPVLARLRAPSSVLRQERSFAEA